MENLVSFQRLARRRRERRSGRKEKEKRGEGEKGRIGDSSVGLGS